MITKMTMKDKYIPHPSQAEDEIAEGTYNEYREQATDPMPMREVIESADPDSILGIIRDIKKSSDAITMIDEDTGEWNC